MSHNLTLAVDFDGVLHDYHHPVEGRKMGPPYEPAKGVLTRWKRQGHMLIIHSVKATTEQGRTMVADWLKYYGLPYDEVTATKPNADWYIDDRAYQHTNWSDTERFITSQMRLNSTKVRVKS